MKNFLQRRQNAITAVEQIRNGEWLPLFNPINRRHLTAHRGGLRLWISNGPFFCEIEGGNYFGRIWRHYVWWAAARRLKRDADRPYREEDNAAPVLE